MKTRHSIYVVICYALLMLVFFFYSLNLEYWKTKLMPLMVSGIGFILAAIQIIKEVRQRKKEATGEINNEKRAESKRPLRGYLYEGGWLVSFFVGFFLLGFASFPLFIAGYLKAHGRRWGICLLFAGAMLIVSYSIFYFFKVRLPWGLILSSFLW